MSREITELLEKLRGDKSAIEAASAPLRAERDELAESIRPTEDRIRVLNKQIRALEQPHLAVLEAEVRTLETASRG